MEASSGLNKAGTSPEGLVKLQTIVTTGDVYKRQVMEWRLGNLYFDMKRPVQAEQMYLAALKTRAEFDREDIYRYRSGTAQFQRSLGELYESHLHDYSKAEKCYLKSVEILQELCENIYERCNYCLLYTSTYKLLWEGVIFPLMFTRIVLRSS